MRTFDDYTIGPATRYRFKVDYHAWSPAECGKAYNWLKERTDQFSHNFRKDNGEPSGFWIADRDIAIMFKLVHGNGKRNGC